MDVIIAAALAGFIVGVLVGGSRRRPVGYTPRSQGGTPNPPPSDP